MTATAVKLELAEDIDARLSETDSQLDAARSRMRSAALKAQSAGSRRAAALTTARDTELKKLEGELAGYEADRQREQDRVTALERKRGQLLAEQKAAEQRARHDRLTRLSTLLQERITGAYARLANELRDLIAEQAAGAYYIERESQQLKRDGAAVWQVPMPNVVRHEPRETRAASAVIVDSFPGIPVGRNLVGPNQDAQRPVKPPMPSVSTFDVEQHRRWYSIRREAEETTGGRAPRPLYEVAVIPAPDWNGDRPLWDASCMRTLRERADEIVAEVLEREGK
ncbi:hypothetical protein BH24PSE2_BH24PSE2_24220 [soil metagenome]